MKPLSNPGLLKQVARTRGRVGGTEAGVLQSNLAIRGHISTDVFFGNRLTRSLLFGLLVAIWVISHAASADERSASQPPELRPHPDAVPNEHSPDEVDRPELVPFVVKNPNQLPGIVVDETQAVLVGKWQYSTHTPPYVGLGYLHDQKAGKGECSVTFTPELPAAGVYEVRLSHCYNIRRSTNTPVTIRHAHGDTSLRINQQEVPEHDRLFRSLGRFQFKAGRQGWVRIATDGTDGKYVIADAVQFLPVPEEASGRSVNPVTP